MITATGTLNPIAQVNVGTQVSGTVAKVNTDFNQRVMPGQILAVIDDALFRSALRQSQAGLASAKSQLALALSNEQRSRDLVGQGFIASQQLERDIQAREAAQAQVDVARALLDKAQTDLANTVIRSPVAGVVIARKTDVGQTVAASFQTPDLFTIAKDLSHMEIYANVSEADVGAVRPDLPVEFRVDAYPERRFSGKVLQVRLNPKTEQGVVTYNVVVRADNLDGVLLPGMTARVDIIAARRDAVLKIANSALRFRPTPVAIDKDDNGAVTGKTDSKAADATISPADALLDKTPRVYVLRQGKPVEVKLKTGITDGHATEVVEGGVQVGDLLVVRDMKAKAPGSVEISF